LFVLYYFVLSWTHNIFHLELCTLVSFVFCQCTYYCPETSSWQNILDIIHEIVLLHFAACVCVNCHTAIPPNFISNQIRCLWLCVGECANVTMNKEVVWLNSQLFHYFCVTGVLYYELFYILTVYYKVICIVSRWPTLAAWSRPWRLARKLPKCVKYISINCMKLLFVITQLYSLLVDIFSRTWWNKKQCEFWNRNVCKYQSQM